MVFSPEPWFKFLKPSGGLLPITVYRMLQFCLLVSRGEVCLCLIARSLSLSASYILTLCVLTLVDHTCLFILFVSQPGFQVCCIFLAICRLSLFSHALLQKLLIFLAFLSMTALALFVILLRPSGATVAMATDDMCLPLYGVLIYISRIIVSHEAQGRIRMSCNEMPAQATFVFVTARC